MPPRDGGSLGLRGLLTIRDGARLFGLRPGRTVPVLPVRKVAWTAAGISGIDLLSITSLIVAGPFSRLRLRGGFSACAAYERARKDLDQNGRTSIRAYFMARLFRMGPLELDVHGFTLNRLMSAHAHAWLDISKPLAVEDIGKRAR